MLAFRWSVSSCVCVYFACMQSALNCEQQQPGQMIYCSTIHIFSHTHSPWRTEISIRLWLFCFALVTIWPTMMMMMMSPFSIQYIFSLHFPLGFHWIEAKSVIFSLATIGINHSLRTYNWLALYMLVDERTNKQTVLVKMGSTILFMWQTTIRMEN